MAGSFTDKNGIIQAKNINKMLENKISQYNNIQKQYNHLIESSLEVKYNTFDYSFDMNMENAISYLKTKTGWTDLENINEMHGLVDVVEESNDDWK